MINIVPVLRIEDLTVSYETTQGILTALRDVSFEIGEGGALGLAGESGSGKSTMALAILDLLSSEAKIKKGSIVFQGQELRKLSSEERRRVRGSKISMVFQDPFSSLNPALPIGIQVSEPLVYHRGLTKNEALIQAVNLLDKVGIAGSEHMVKVYPHQLSGGMQQRALIATALACDPDLLILDEPTTALDVTIEAQIMDLLEDLRKSRHLSILFISHNLGLLGRLCDKICILYAGVILEHGTTQQVFSQPVHPYTKGLLASLPRLTADTTSRRLNPIPGNFPDMTVIPPGCVFNPRCPFVEPRCTAEAPKLIAMEDGRHVRCWRAKIMDGHPWEVEESKTETQFQPMPAQTNQKALIEATDVQKYYRIGGLLSGFKIKSSKPGYWKVSYDPLRVRADDGLSLAISPREVIGLVGESGCGKTTLGRCMVRLLEPTMGRIIIDGRDITREPEKKLRTTRQKAQIIFQNPDSSLNPRKTVGQIIGRPLSLFGIDVGADLKRRVFELLEMVRLPQTYVNRYPHQLSGGEKQRVGIARALATSPKFIVCDEAVSALDVSVQASILNLLNSLRQEFGLAYLFISHDLSVVAHMADRIAVMYMGFICEEGTVPEVLQPPYHPYTEALLSAVPTIDDEKGGTARIRLQGDILSRTTLPSGCRFHTRCPKKIGAICEEKAPPIMESSSGHRIVCHMSVVELRETKPTN